MIIDIEALPHQKQVINSETYVTSMSCGIGAGKSFTAALLAIIELLRGKRVLMIAPTGAMIRDVLISEMNNILSRHGIPYSHNKSTNDIFLGNGRLFCKSDKNRDTINGLTKIDTVIMDECRLLNEKTYIYATSRQRGIPSARCYLFGTGCSKAHWFAKRSMKEGTTWVNADIYSNIKYNGEDYVERMLKEYEGLPEEFVKRELYGLFTDGDEFSLFDTIVTNAPFVPGQRIGGLDIAGTGADYSVIAIFEGNKLICLEKKRTMMDSELYTWRNQLAELYQCKIWRHDATGIGNLMSWKDSYPINFGAGAGSRFASMRTKIYFDLKEKLQKGICFDNNKIRNMFNNEAMAELMCTKMCDRETAKLKLIDKSDIKKIIGRSPDVTDALALASVPVANAIDPNYQKFLAQKNNPFSKSRLSR